MNERDWSSLVWGLRQGNCILLLGDEASGTAAHTTRQQLTDHLKGGLRTEVPDGLEFPQIAWLYQSENGRNDLLAQVVAFYERGPAEPLNVHRQLAALPFHCIVTSSHDALMPRALELAQKKALVAAYDFKGSVEQLPTVGSAEAPLLYHLFGRPSRPRSLVLTEQDLVDFLVAVVSSNPPIPNVLRKELRDPEKMFLFLGFGVRNWYPRVLLHALREQSGNSRSFALEEFPPPADLGRGIFFYRHGFKVEVFDRCVATFVEELTRRVGTAAPPAARTGVGSRGGAAVSVAPAVPGGIRPSVFICHVHENADLARRIAQGLEQQGFDPWLDQTNLDPGANWNDEIERRIREVDYFLILVSQELAAQDESYAFRELRLAQRRAESIRLRSFIIPLTVMGAPMLPELDDLHQGPVRGAGTEDPMLLTDETEPQVIERLASSLRRDVQLRLKKGA